MFSAFIKRGLSCAIGLMLGRKNASTYLAQTIPLREALFILGISSIIFSVELSFYFAKFVTDNTWRLVIFIALVLTAFGILLLAAVLEAGLTFWVTRRIGKIPHFKILLCIILFLNAVFMVPSILTVGVGEKSWEGWWFSLLFDAGASIWFFAVLLRALKFTHGLSTSQSCKAVVPLILVSTTLLFAGWTAFPPTLYNAQRWQRHQGERITVYYPRNEANPSELLEESGNILRRISEYWGVEMPGDTIGVFLFPNKLTHRKVFEGEELTGAAHPEELAISLVYGEWKQIQNTVTHELTHLVTYRSIAESLPALVNEGIAMHTESLLRGNLIRPRPYSNLSLLELARSERFYDRKSEVIFHYAHGAAFVRQAIDEFGMHRFKEFCRRLSARRERELLFGDERSQFAEVFEQTYGISVADWELAWRNPRSDDANFNESHSTGINQP